MQGVAQLSAQRGAQAMGLQPSFDSKPLDSIIHALHPCTTLLLQRLSQRGEALPPRASAWALVWAASGVSGPERNYLAAQLNELGAGEIAHLSLAM